MIFRNLCLSECIPTLFRISLVPVYQVLGYLYMPFKITIGEGLQVIQFFQI